MAGWLGELEDRVPLWFDGFDEHDILARWLADNFKDIVPGQCTESKVTSAIGGFPAHSGLADFIHNFFESEAMFGIREVVEADQVGAGHFVRTRGGVNVSVIGLLLLALLLQVSKRGRDALPLLFGHVIKGDACTRERHCGSSWADHGHVASNS